LTPAASAIVRVLDAAKPSRPNASIAARISASRVKDVHGGILINRLNKSSDQLTAAWIARSGDRWRAAARWLPATLVAPGG